MMHGTAGNDDMGEEMMCAMVYIVLGRLSTPTVTPFPAANSSAAAQDS